MRLRIGAVLFALGVLQLALVGCGGGSSSTSTTPTNPAVTLKSIQVSPSTATVVVGKNQSFTATGTYSDGSSKDITSSVSWSSAATNVVAITSSGAATAVSGGVAQGGSQTVTVSATSGSVTGAAQMTVTDYLVSIAVSPSSATINAGSTEQFHANGTYQDGSNPDITGSVTWSISPASVATIVDGLASGLGSGSATVTAKSGTMLSTASLSVGSTLASIVITAPNNATSVYVAGTLALTATGNYNGGPQQNLTNSAIWSVASANGSAGAATIINGQVQGTHGGSITVTAQVGSVVGSINLNVVAVVNSLVVGAPCPAGFQCVGGVLIGPGVLSGASQQFSAIATFNDGTTGDVSSSACWTSSASTVLSFTATCPNSGLGSAGVQGAAMVTASVTNPLTNQQVTASSAVNVVSSLSNSGALADGGYAFTLLSANGTGPVFYAGSFVASGGNISSGVVDMNAGGTVTTFPNLTGVYVVFPDGRGEIQFNQNEVFNNPTGLTLRLILSQTGTVGKLMEFDGLGTMKGSLWQQSGPVTAQPEGNYVFRASGMDASSDPLGEVGIFTATGGATDTITGGTIDIDDFSKISSALNLSQSTINPTQPTQQSGRGTFSITQGPNTTNYAFYVISAEPGGAPTLANFIETDPGPGVSAVAGTMALQTGSSGGYTVGTMATGFGYSFLLDRPIVAGNCVAPPCQTDEFAQVGEYTFTGSGFSGTMTGLRDDTNVPSANNPFAVSGTVGMGGGVAVGRGFTDTAGSDSDRGYVIYMASATQGYVLQSDTTYHPIEGSYNAPVGEMDQQTIAPGSFNLASLTGAYALDASDVVSPGLTTELMWLYIDGQGHINGIADASVGSSGTSTALNSTVITSSYGSPDPTSGRLAVSLTSNQQNNFAMYILSQQSAWVLNVDPAMDGSLSLQ